MKKFYSLLTAILVCLLVFPGTSLAATFSDVPTSHPNYNDITYLLDRGIIDEGRKFGVSDIVTREEVAVMVSKAVGLDGTQRTTKFKDVPQSSKNSGYIQSAAEAGIINGYDDGTFKPNATVTRGHMAAFIARAFDLPTGSKTFKDVPKSHTAYDAVKQLAAAGITTGYNDGTFKPQNNLSRAHISAFLARAVKYQEDQEGTEVVTKPTTVTPKPEETKNEKGKTRNTAAKINETILIDINDWLYGAQKYDLTLTEVISGQKAWSMIEEANMFNDEPDPGTKYVLAKFKVKIYSLEEEPFDISSVDFDAVSKGGTKYNEYFSVVTPSPSLRTDLYIGAEHEGWAYFMVNENDSPKVVYKSGHDGERWFDLGL